MVDETRLSRKALSPESRPKGSGNAGCRRTGLGPRFICGLPVFLACTLHVSSLSGGQLTEPEHHARTSTSDRAPHAEDLLIGAVLPLSGPPALSSFADLIRQGVELAVAVRNDRGADIELLIRDYRAEPLTASIHTRELELQGADGMVGYLEEAALRAAAGYGVRVPLVSPTARNADAAGRWAYSLEGPDPISARKMARFAREEGYDRVAVLHEGAPASYAEARAFVDEADRIGLPVMTVVSQESGAPHFADQLSTLVTALRSEEIMALGLEEDDTLDVSLLDPVAAYITVPRRNPRAAGAPVHPLRSRHPRHRHSGQRGVDSSGDALARRRSTHHRGFRPDRVPGGWGERGSVQTPLRIPLRAHAAQLRTGSGLRRGSGAAGRDRIVGPEFRRDPGSHRPLHLRGRSRSTANPHRRDPGRSSDRARLDGFGSGHAPSSGRRYDER